MISEKYGIAWKNKISRRQRMKLELVNAGVFKALVHRSLAASKHYRQEMERHAEKLEGTPR